MDDTQPELSPSPVRTSGLAGGPLAAAAAQTSTEAIDSSTEDDEAWPGDPATSDNKAKPPRTRSNTKPDWSWNMPEVVEAKRRPPRPLNPPQAKHEAKAMPIPPVQAKKMPAKQKTAATDETAAAESLPSHADSTRPIGSFPPMTRWQRDQRKKLKIADGIFVDGNDSDTPPFNPDYDYEGNGVEPPMDSQPRY